MRRLLRYSLVLLISLSVAFAAPKLSEAQQLPPSGNSGFMFFCEQISVGPSSVDFLTVVDTAAALGLAPGATIPPALQITLNYQSVVGVHRRAFQVGRDPAIAITTDGASPAPIIGVLTTDGSNSYLEVVDFRQPFPPTAVALPLVGSGGGGYVPYDVLVHPNRSFYVHSQLFTPAAGFGLGATEQFIVSPGNPVIAGGSANHSRNASQYASRLDVDPQTGNVLVPLFDQIDILTPNLATLVASVPTGTTPGGAPYQVGSNLGVSSDNFGSNVFCALRPPITAIAAPSILPPVAGHSWLAFSGGNGAFTTGSANPLGNAPSGAPWVFAAGFHEPLITTAAIGSVVTMLLDDPGNALVGTGMVMQLQNQTSNLIEFQAALPQSPFGNPEGSSTSDALVMLSGPVQDALIAVGTGVASPIATLSAAVTTTGLYTVNTIDRPLLLPGSNTAQVHYGLVNVGSEQFTLGSTGAAPTLALGAFVVAPGAPSSYANRLVGGLLGSLPIALQGFSAPAVSTNHDFIYAPGIGVSYSDQYAPAGGLPAIPLPTFVGAVFDPPIASSFGRQGPRDAGFNFAQANPASGMLVLPGHWGVGANVADYIKIYPVSFAPGSFAIYYTPQNQATISTEIFQL